MRLELTLKNYRCFSETRPARIVWQKGFTALLGVNNSGKSSLLKFFYEFRNLFLAFAGSTTQDLLAALQGNPRVFNLQPTISDIGEMFCNRNEHDIELRLRITSADCPAARDRPPPPKEVILTVPRVSNTWRMSIVVGSDLLDTNGLRITTTPAGGTDHPTVFSGEQGLADLYLYVQACRKLADTLYVGAFRNAISVGMKQTYYDIDVGQAFIARWRTLKTGGSRKQNEAIYRLTDDIRHIFQFTALEINPSPDDQTLQLFIDGKSYTLPELGSGLAQFIVVLANAAVKRPAYVLIDEPELNLHSSLQIDFLTTLASYAGEGILFATHNYGLARATGELVYSVRQGPDGLSELAPIEATPRLSEFLGELSFSGYRELGFEKILLVEGTTEVKTVQQFLRKLRKDHQVVLLPLGGSGLIGRDSETELLEIKRICENVSALIDSERPTAGAPLEPVREAFRQTCQKVGIRCHVLERRATENYFADAAVKAVKGASYQALGHYQELKKAALGWAKSENWRIAREMVFEDVRETDLGPSSHHCDHLGDQARPPESLLVQPALRPALAPHGQAPRLRRAGHSLRAVASCQWLVASGQSAVAEKCAALAHRLNHAGPDHRAEYTI